MSKRKKRKVTVPKNPVPGSKAVPVKVQNEGVFCRVTLPDGGVFLLESSDYFSASLCGKMLRLAKGAFLTSGEVAARFFFDKSLETDPPSCISGAGGEAARERLWQEWVSNARRQAVIEVNGK